MEVDDSMGGFVHDMPHRACDATCHESLVIERTGSLHCIGDWSFRSRLWYDNLSFVIVRVIADG